MHSGKEVLVDIHLWVGGVLKRLNAGLEILGVVLVVVVVKALEALNQQAYLVTEGDILSGELMNLLS